MNRLSFVLLIAVAALVFCAQVALADEQKANQPPFASQDSTTLSILDAQGRPAFRYRFAEVAAKPYVDQLFSPGGVQVLRDSPHDHKHHHALMFAVAVDGVNFWEEQGDTFGRQRQRSLGRPKTTTQDGLRRAGFIEELDWLGPADKPLLVERREIDALALPNQDATLVEWRCELQPPEGRGEAKLSGRHYYGLGLRFVESMDRDARVFFADEKKSEAGPDASSLTFARWCAISAKADGKPVTVAVFDHPSNPRHPARMFTKEKGFSYLSATLNLWKEPLVVRAGEPLKLRWAVAVWDGAAEPAAIDRLYRRWAETGRK